MFINLRVVKKEMERCQGANYLQISRRDCRMHTYSLYTVQAVWIGLYRLKGRWIQLTDPLLAIERSQLLDPLPALPLNQWNGPKAEVFYKKRNFSEACERQKELNRVSAASLSFSNTSSEAFGTFFEALSWKKLVNNFEKKSFDEKKSLRVNDSTNLIDKRSISVLFSFLFLGRKKRRTW